ncbi:helix-turn-helix domain-containing protein [uncultured Clostridium sp.]|uniref:helix-turn-helix domain-containing protein n=1 Tax=uncultured Clostridium sp. TaxID=59620 RepID=UPI0025E2F26D|nr:helix-turn-helix domain-containing protein [uncultured Clostridium sp.]
MARQEIQELLAVSEISSIYGVQPATIQKHIREHKLKAKKIGKKYMVTRRDLNVYLGIENNEEDLRKDLEIANLKAKVKTYEYQLKTIKAMISNLDNIIGL